MTPGYLAEIQRATDAPTLHALSDSVASDELLSLEMRNELLELIKLRFCSLNSAAVDQQPKRRW